MKKFLLISCCCTLVFVSCRRDDSNLTQNGQLTLIVDSILQADTLAILDSTLFYYDQAGQLAGWSARNDTGIDYSRRDFMITRDAQNRVAKVTDNYLKVYSRVSPMSYPTIIHEVHYAGATDQASFIYDYPDGNTPSSGDSAALTYSGANISDVKRYPVLPATAKSPFSETSWTYDNSGRLISSIYVKENLDGPFISAYAFDDKLNPLKFDVEAVFSDPARMSNGNLVSSQQNLLGYGNTDPVNFDYTYRTDGRPLRAVSAGLSRNVTTYVYSN